MELLLNKREMLDLGENLHGVSIVCREGRCWITQAGDSRDHILCVGDRFVVNSSGQLIITATEPCRLMLDEFGMEKQPAWFAKAFFAILKSNAIASS